MSLQLHDALPAEVEWDGEIDLERFERLAEEDRLRVIIRVLCGLVALEEEDWFSGPPADEPRTRTLPYLGYERQAQLALIAQRERAPRRTLPLLGTARDF